MNVPFGTTLILLEGSAKGHFYGRSRQTLWFERITREYLIFDKNK